MNFEQIYLYNWGWRRIDEDSSVEYSEAVTK